MDSVEIKLRVISCLRCFSFDLLWFYSCTLECGTPTVQPDVPRAYLRCSPEHTDQGKIVLRWPGSSMCRTQVQDGEGSGGSTGDWKQEWA